MGWKCFQVCANAHPNTAGANAAPIITEYLGDCTYANEKLTYTYGGTTYSVNVKSGNSSQMAEYILSLNTDTGEFFISATAPYFKSNAFYDYIASAIFLVQTDANSKVLVPVTSFAGNYSGVVNVLGAVSSPNTKKSITLYPAITCTEYADDVKFKPMVNYYVTYLHLGIKAGQTVELDGQRFLCVACSLFTKL